MFAGLRVAAFQPFQKALDLFVEGVLINKLSLIVNGLQTLARTSVDSRGSMDIQGFAFETLSLHLFLQ